MKRSLARLQAAAAAVTLVAAASSAHAQLLYSFETLYNAGTPAGPGGVPPAVPPAPDPSGTRPDDFHANGGTATQDTIGATDQAHSLKYSQAMSDTFTGAVTELIPAHLNDDNAAIMMDITVPSTGNFVGSFANMGITEFGANPNLGTAGGSVQVIGEAEANISLSAGTHHIGIPLIGRTNPLTLDSNISFASAFGPDTNSQMTPTGWEFFINKSSDSPLTIYVDNVRTLQMIPGDLNYDGKVNAEDFAILAANYGASGTQATISRGDLNLDDKVDSQDFNLLAANYNHSVSPAPSLGTIVPEPVGAWQLCGIGTAFAVAQRRRNARNARWAANSDYVG